LDGGVERLQSVLPHALEGREQGGLLHGR
jgi:hypothetical protein